MNEVPGGQVPCCASLPSVLAPSLLCSTELCSGCGCRLERQAGEELMGTDGEIRGLVMDKVHLFGVLHLRLWPP